MALGWSEVIEEAAAAVGGDLSGTQGAATVVGIQTRPVSDDPPNDGDVLTWNAGTNTWEPAAGGGGGGIPDAPNDGTLYARKSAAWVQPALADTTGTLAINRGGTGATTASAARQALLPAASSGNALISDGVSDATFATLALANTSGSLDLGTRTTGTLALNRGGTGATTATGARQALLPTAATGKALVSDGVSDATFANIDIVGATTGTLTTARGGTGVTSSGSSGNVLRSNGTTWDSTALALADTSGTLPLNRGGTGSTTQPAAANAILPAQSANRALISDGSNVAFAQVNLASTVTGTLPAANGGTGLTSPGNRGHVLMSDGSAWVSIEVAGVKRIWICDDFLPGSISGELGWQYTGNGAGNFGLPNNANISGEFGHYTLNKGTSATGRAALSFETAASQLPFVQPWLAGPCVQEWRVYLDAVDVDFEAAVSLGAGAATSGQVFDSGVGLICNTSVSPNWIFESHNATTVVSTVTTSVAVPTATWVYIRIEIDVVSARVYIGATKAAATLAATIPIASVTTLVALGPLAKIRSLSAVAGRNFRIGLHTTDLWLDTSR